MSAKCFVYRYYNQMERLMLNHLSGSRSKTDNSLHNVRKDKEKLRIMRKNEYDNKLKRQERIDRLSRAIARDGDAAIINDLFPPEPPEPEPVLTKFLIRDYILFDRVDDLGRKYRYGVFAVFSSFTKLDSDGNYLDPNVASNVDNETRVLTVKSVITPQTFGSNSSGTPLYVEDDPVIEFLTTDEDPTDFIDQLYLYQFSGERFLELKKNTRKKVERDDLEDVIDPMGTPFSIESAVSMNQDSYNRHILDLFYTIVNQNYVSSTAYEILMQTVIVMLGI